ncbi:hypothetical protein A5893_11805 [Pedobacter psychrophilus]|uniref:Uncharacterized protein n=1 Tax=Pedobacter psychrophilus TaxID=1826909 RepID=A0A179DCM7_9SPHI|nr:hypothetical protein [Pedobacter psychrophilus]OAQ38728.1 hypothetical protein A5893_11805 [Pedobacter psychrophilus]
MKDEELRIWDYIDGLSSEDERTNVEQLIRTDLVFKAKYEELLAANSDFDLIGLDAPSMVFTNKVMHQIYLEAKPLSAKAKTDKKIIYLIAGLFGLMMVACIMVGINQIDWSINNSTPFSIMPKNGLNLKSFSGEISNGFINKFFYGFLMFDMIVGLMFLDKLMRKKSPSF